MGDRLRSWHLALAIIPVLIAGCGEPGSPQPPSLNLPVAVQTLAAARTGNVVHLTWTSVNKTTDHTTPAGPVTMHICRMQADGPCVGIADSKVKLGVAAFFDDNLPPEVIAGKHMLLTYYVELQNHARKSAGRSNPAYSASGPSPAPLTGLSLTTRAEGVVLHWDAAQGAECDECRVSIERTLQGNENAKPAVERAKPVRGFNPLAASAPVPKQTLEVPAQAGSNLAEALDTSAIFGETYEYRARLVESIELAGHTLELVGQQSDPATIATRDTFPPAVPQDLAAVADEQSKAIDLSWTPDSEADLAGYFVYRRESGSNAQPQRISGQQLLATATFHDTQVQAGIRYAYSVSAVDQSGNESARSGEAEETLALPQ